MNYLVHLYLAEPSDGSLLGNLMGDFVKGPLDNRFPPDLAAGIAMHRHIDSFAQTDTVFRVSKNRLDPGLSYFRGILVDIFYDHILARHWSRFSSTPLETFAERVYALLQSHHAVLPEGLRQVAPRMIRGNWLVSYRDEATIRTVLRRISQRLSRPNPLPQGFGEWQRHGDDLTRDFAEFLPRAQESARRFLADNSPAAD
ncbi:MAG: DUF479 domain-containing protein [Desulfuromonadales bacterium]|nr:DUF479 domain-containing protein [Desulfuromonadales bacterium]NIR32966.1 DUF479 domain-containing protein [Desulfuromonadales bacterium]NIS40524.1 DUF479 domain-containing protein [Desulfuromonadales bacterium]